MSLVASILVSNVVGAGPQSGADSPESFATFWCPECCKHHTKLQEIAMGLCAHASYVQLHPLGLFPDAKNETREPEQKSSAGLLVEAALHGSRHALRLLCRSFLGSILSSLVNKQVITKTRTIKESPATDLAASAALYSSWQAGSSRLATEAPLPLFPKNGGAFLGSL